MEKMIRATDGDWLEARGAAGQDRNDWVILLIDDQYLLLDPLLSDDEPRKRAEKAVMEEVVRECLANPVVSKVVAVGFSSEVLDGLRDNLLPYIESDRLLAIVDVFDDTTNGGQPGFTIIKQRLLQRGERGFGLAPDECAIFSKVNLDEGAAELHMRHFIQKSVMVHGTNYSSTKKKALERARSDVRDFMAEMIPSPLEVSPRWSAEQILEAMQPLTRRGAKFFNAYFLGSFGRQITIAGQQRRGINLIRALHEKLQADTVRVGVIGGGFAGVTSAMAAATLGWKVYLYEKENRLIPRQDGAYHRFVHPNVLLWPHPSSAFTRAVLPFLDWYAGTADGVAASVRGQFAQSSKVRDNVEIVMEEVREIDFRNGRYRLSCGVGRDWMVDVLIVAVGFGEDEIDGVSANYWTVDPLLEHGKKRSVLVSGGGDGGLIDLVRSCLTVPDDMKETPRQGLSADHVHRFLVDYLCSSAQFRQFGMQFSEIEKAWLERHQSGRKDMSLLSTLVKELELPVVFLDIADNWEREDTDVLYLLRDGDLNSDAALLNKAIGLCLIKTGLTSVDRGEVKGNSVTVGDAVRELDDFDVVLLRHGPDIEALELGQPEFIREGLDYFRRQTHSKWDIGSVLDLETFAFFVSKNAD